jgi:UDP-glucose 4-epimerase
MSTLGIPEEDLKGARVIVTGASGFIGFNLVKTLSRLGAEVLVIDRTQPLEQFSNVEFEWADLRHLDKTYDTDYLIHLAAVTNAGYAERFPLDTYETNVLGTVNLLNHVNVKTRVLFPSTALTYKASETPITEDGEVDLSSTYALSKNMGEQIIRFHCKRMGVAHTLVRFFNIFGPGQLPMYIVPQVLRQAIEDRKVVVRNGAVMRDLLYVDDCIDVVLKLVVHPAAVDSVFNIGSGYIVTISDIARAAVEAAGDPSIEIVDLEQNISNSPTALMADITKVTSTVDWFPRTSLKEGLNRMREAYLQSRKG